LSENVRTRSEWRLRRKAIMDHVQEHPKRPLREVAAWAVAERLGPRSTIYGDLNAMVDRGELIRLPGEHGDILVLRESVSFAEPGMVRERVRVVLDNKRTQDLRTAALADLVDISATHDILPEHELLDLFRIAALDRELPGRSLSLKLLQKVAAQCDAPPSLGRDLMDWERIRKKLRSTLGAPLLDVVHEDLAQAEWAAEVVATISKGGGAYDVAMALLRSALDRRHSMPTFEAVLGSIVKGIAILMASSPERARLRRDLRLGLDRALDSPSPDDRERARLLSNELRSLLSGA